MTLFWVLAGVMLFVACLFTLPVLLRGAHAEASDPDVLNAEIIKAQLAELETDLERGRLDATQYRSAREDLERELLADLSSASVQPGAAKLRSGRWASMLLLVLIPALTLGLYYKYGTRQIIPLLEQGAVASQSQPHAEDASFADMVEVLAARLRENPDNAAGWAMLARSYQTLQRFDDAVLAYATAHRLSGDDASLLVDYVDALVMANGKRFSVQAGELLLKALNSEPGNLKALWLAGHWQYQQGEFAGAVRYWQRAADVLPPESENARMIAQQIREARQQLPAGEINGSPSAKAPGASEQAAEKSIVVRVALDPQLAAATLPGDTLFVFARALSGPRMPLAIVRRQVSDLPLTVTLDDSTAMTPALTLSSFEAVTVGARISRSGMAMPQSGDLHGQVSPVQPGSGVAVALTIDRKIP